MSASGLPVDVVVELRGTRPAGQFVNRESGQLVEYPASAKFEYELPNGDVGNLEVSGSALAKAEGGFDFNTAQKGQKVRLVGVVRDGDRGSYLQVLTAEPGGAEQSNSASRPAAARA
jgi:hypothetical protein